LGTMVWIVSAILPLVLELFKFFFVIYLDLVLIIISIIRVLVLLNDRHHHLAGYVSSQYDYSGLVEGAGAHEFSERAFRTVNVGCKEYPCQKRLRWWYFLEAQLQEPTSSYPAH